LKQTSKTLLTTAMLATAVFSSVAMAEQKIGAVNVQSIFQAMPQAAAIQQTIADEFKDQTEEVKRLEKDVKYYLEKYQRDAATMSATEKADLEKNIGTLREEYTAKAQPLQQTIQNRLNEERNKLLGLIKQSVDNVAAKEKYDIVLQAESVAFISPDRDISKAVLDQVSKIK
jgi:outer membrane protein